MRFNTLERKIVTQQHIPMDGTPNFRDLGGYKSRCGKQVRSGRLFRSGVLSALSDADLQRMDERNIVTICDFRRDEERQRDPTRLHAQRPARIVHMPIDPGSRGNFFEQLAEPGETKNVSQPEFDMASFMVQINRSFALDHHATFKLMLDEINGLDEQQGLLFHCSAGKDRTGFAAALILMCLNVPRETIRQDYMLTAKYFKPDIEISRLQKKYSEYGFDKVSPDNIRPMLEVHEHFIEEAFAAIDEQFGSTEAYLTKVYGLGEAELSNMQSKLLY